MPTYLLLLILACALMMIFMLRGMHGGHDTGAGDEKPPHDEQLSRDHVESTASRR